MLPGKGDPPLPIPQPNPANPVQRVTVTGPASLRPGETIQLSASALWADGQIRDITNEVEWTSADDHVLSAARGGIITGLNAGEAFVHTRFQGKDYGARVFLVLPPGTVRLSGRVREGDFGVFGALVEAVGAQGLATTTDWSGSYTLIGAPAEADIRVTKERFTPIVTNVQLAVASSPERRRLDIAMTPLRSAASYAGTYTLELTADCPETSSFPAELRHRRYTVLLDDNGDNVVLHLGGADFAVDASQNTGNLITGNVDEAVARLRLGESWDWGVYPDVVERLSDGMVLVVTGLVEAVRTAAGLRGTLDGSFGIHKEDNIYAAPIDSCKSATHQFTLSR
jgi:hypothetical protein